MHYAIRVVYLCLFVLVNPAHRASACTHTYTKAVSVYAIHPWVTNSHAKIISDDIPLLFSNDTSRTSKPDPFTPSQLQLFLVSLFVLSFILGGWIFFLIWRLREQAKIVHTQQTTLSSLKQEACAGADSRHAFLRLIGHELRTPLNGIIGFSSLLEASSLKPEQIEYASLIHTSGNELLTKFNAMLDYAHIQAGTISLEAKPFLLQQTIDEALDAVSRRARKKHLVLAYSAEPTTPQVLLGDAKRLQQALFNLLWNAVTFTASGSVSLHVSTQPLAGNQRVQFKVQDTGDGIPTDRLQTIFDPFVQVDSSTTRSFEGIGLGLAVSKHLAEQMGGAIQVTSTVGKGSTFQLTVLAPEAPLDTIDPFDLSRYCMTKSMTTFVDKRNVQVGVYESRTSSLNLTERLFQQLGYAIDRFTQPEALFEAVQRTPYQILFVEVCPPNFEGITLSKRIRQASASVDKPSIIGLSMDHSEQLITACKQARMNGLLKKPVRLRGYCRGNGDEVCFHFRRS